jgi:small subunit ribosomal protein S7
MPRRREVVKREVLPDPKYGDKLVTKFINNLMWDGKKSIAESIFYGSMDIIKERTGEDPLTVFQQALSNVKPTLEVKSRRVGGATYQVPVEVRAGRKNALAMRWLIGFARERGEKTMEARLAGEFMDAASNEGASIKKKQDTFRMAEANKAFAHYRW